MCLQTDLAGKIALAHALNQTVAQQTHLELWVVGGKDRTSERIYLRALWRGRQARNFQSIAAHILDTVRTGTTLVSIIFTECQVSPVRGLYCTVLSRARAQAFLLIEILYVRARTVRPRAWVH